MLSLAWLHPPSCPNHHLSVSLPHHLKYSATLCNDITQKKKEKKISSIAVNEFRFGVAEDGQIGKRRRKILSFPDESGSACFLSELMIEIEQNLTSEINLLYKHMLL